MSQHKRIAIIFPLLVASLCFAHWSALPEIGVLAAYFIGSWHVAMIEHERQQVGS